MTEPPADLRPTAQPLHRQLQALLMARIESGEWSPGTYLPSETRLATDYGVSVGTLRKALLDLAAQGVVLRRQGKGTVVASHDSDAVLFRFFNLRRADGSRLHPESRVLRRRTRNATAQEVALLGLTAPARVVEITRIREADGTPIIVERIALDAARFGALSRTPASLPNTLYQLYQTDFGVTVHQAEEWLRAIPAPPEATAALGLPEGAPVMEIRRLARDYAGAPVELRVSLVATEAHPYVAAL